MKRIGWMLLCVLAVCALLSVACSKKQGGIHARLGYAEETGLRVTEVPEGPSLEAGLRVDDRIIEIDGDPVRDMKMDEVVRSLRGKVGSTVQLKVARDDELLDLKLKRSAYRR